MSKRSAQRKQDVEATTAAKLLAQRAREVEKERTQQWAQRRKMLRDLCTSVGGAVGFRYRAQLRPFYVLAGLYVAGLLADASGNPRGVVALAVLAGVPGVLFWLRGALARRAEQLYALACCAAGVAWLGLAAAGLTGQRAVDVTAVTVWGIAAWLWLREHRVRDAPEQPAVDSDLAVWWEQTGLFPGSRLEHVEAIPNGNTATLVLPPGKGNTTTAVIRAAEDIASAREKSLTTTLVEHTKDRAANRAQLTLLDASQVETVHPWPGPSLDPATGLAVVGPYADHGVAKARWWRPGSGPVHWLVSGASDAGKSRLLDWMLLESAHSGLIASWVGDPQGGQSLPAWRDTAHRFEDEPDAIVAMLADLEREMDARSRHLARLEWVDEQGRTWVGKEDFDPTPDMPIIEVVIDEAQDILEPGSRALKLLTRLVRKGRKCGIRVVLVTHVPSVDQLGGSMTLRAQLVAGNVFTLRTADNVTKNMVLPPSFPVNPYDLPRETADGESTAGTMYLYGPGARPVPLRNWLIGKERVHALAADAPKIPLTLLSGPSCARGPDAFPRSGETEEAEQESPLRALSDMLPAGIIHPNPDDPEGAETLLAARDIDITREINTAEAILGLPWGQHPEQTRAQIIDGTGCGVSAVQKALKQLTEAGQLERAGHGYYRLAHGKADAA